jgi:putative phosphoesterase
VTATTQSVLDGDEDEGEPNTADNRHRQRRERQDALLPVAVSYERNYDNDRNPGVRHHGEHVEHRHPWHRMREPLRTPPAPSNPGPAARCRVRYRSSGRWPPHVLDRRLGPVGDAAVWWTLGGRRLDGVIDVLLVADTHLDATRAALLPERIGSELVTADLVLHAGDITDVSVLHALAVHAPVHAVKGNNDVMLDLPDRVSITIDGCVVAMVHDSGPVAGRARRLRRWFPRADVVVFGHSHLPWYETDVDMGGHVQHQVNPGSAIVRRRAPTCTVAHVIIEQGQVREVRHVQVGEPATRVEQNRSRR